MMVYEGTITREQAEAAWKEFANPPKVIVTKIGRNSTEDK
jgi:hypothetical protein